MAVNSFSLAVISFSMATLRLMGLRQLVLLLLQLVLPLLLNQHRLDNGEPVHQPMFQLQCTRLRSRTRTPRTLRLDKLDSKPQLLRQRCLAFKLSWHGHRSKGLPFPVHQEFTRRPLFLLLLVDYSEESQIPQVPFSIDSDSPDHRLLLLEDHQLLQQCQRLRLLQLLLLLVRNL